MAGADDMVEFGLVSIHARHCWRANVALAVTEDAQKLVSIHARHCWRANEVSSPDSLS